MIHHGDAAQLSAFMTISGFNWDPNDCTRTIGLEPSEIRRRPERMVRDGKRLIAWSIGFRRKEFDDTNDALSELMSMVWGHREEIKSFVRNQELEISFECNVTIWKNRPLYCLGPEVLGKLAWFECEFVLDIFDYSEDGENEDDAE